MIARFSLYGFLKNQRYFEAFLVLAFLEKGLDFLQIGLLIACRELAVELVEVPSGAIADVWGRRSSMIFAFVSYIGSFLALGLAASMPVLVGGMVLYGIGDAFRTGTHKAMIFQWLHEQGRTGERVKIYGYTRSWSKIGSAVSVLIAATIVVTADRYTDVFLIAIIPYGLAIVNFLGYPRSLDRGDDQDTPRASIGDVARHLVATVRHAARRPGLRKLLFEAMGFDGVFGAVKDYLQPVLAAVALTATAGWALGDASDTQRTAPVVAVVYATLFLLAGVASRNAHRVSDRLGSEARASRWLWGANTLAFALFTAFALVGRISFLVPIFIGLYVLHNIWRPVLIARFDDEGDRTQAASLLSLENQAQRLATMILAPLLGFAVDTVAAHGSESIMFWPLGVTGLVVSAAFFAAGRRRVRQDRRNGGCP